MSFNVTTNAYEDIHDANGNEYGVMKNYWLPAIEIVALNLSVGAFNTYITKKDFAKITWRSIGDNFRTGFTWDEDGYLMNQFLHPYHGAAYFSAARSNGHGFWTSIPYAIFGSLMWEYVMENEPPSYNDIMNTPITGTILGEISWRVSDLIIDESTSGFERVLREFSSTLINPMRGFNRLVKGEMWRERADVVKENVDIDLSLGVLNVFFNDRLDENSAFLMMRANLNYGDQFDVDANKKPFDYFSLQAEVNAGPGDNIAGIFASGVLWDDPIRLLGSSKSMIGIYKDIDILINRVYKLSASTATAQIVSGTELSSKVNVESVLGISAILMGATNSEHASEYDRDHNVGPGASAKAAIRFSIRQAVDVYAHYKRYWIHTLSGAKSEQFVGLLNAGVNLHYSTSLKFAFEALLYERYGRYVRLPNTKSHNTGVRFFITHRL